MTARTACLALAVLAACFAAVPAHAVMLRSSTIEEKKIDVFTIIQRSDRYRVNISYPATGNAVADEELAIWARDQATAFITAVQQIPVHSPLPYELTITYTTLVASPRVLSVIFTISASTGGAHPEPGLATFVYNRRDGRRLTYDDLFMRREGLLAALSEFCSRALAEQLGDKAVPGMIKAGTAPEIANFDLFAVSPEGLTIYFPPYQAAPYSAGYLQVSVPLGALDAFKPQLPFWNKEPAQ